MLCRISVPNNGLHGQGFRWLADGIKGNQTLLSLDVYANYAGPEAVAALCRCVWSKVRWAGAGSTSFVGPVAAR